jgi:hypothetical protein
MLRRISVCLPSRLFSKCRRRRHLRLWPFPRPLLLAQSLARRRDASHCDGFGGIRLDRYRARWFVFESSNGPNMRHDRCLDFIPARIFVCHSSICAKGRRRRSKRRKRLNVRAFTKNIYNLYTIKNKNPEFIGVFRSVVREMSMVRPFADVCAGLRILANRPSCLGFSRSALRILAPAFALMVFLSPNYAQFPGAGSFVFSACMQSFS